jgi:glutamate-ammonia-ligase adenylyltransferase
MPLDQGFQLRAPAASRYAQRLAQARPELFQAALAAIGQVFEAEAMRAFLAAQPAGDEAELKRALRQLRQQVMLRVLLRDLSGRAPLAEVVASMSDLAELSLGYALRHLCAWQEAQHGVPMSKGKRQALIVLGMGKLGGRELNVSSDIDLIFVYPEDGETVCDRAGQRPLSNHEYFTRLARKLIDALADITEDGQVFRVDMRLRPNGDSGPLACSFDSLENYFIAEGREWERYAWIKARIVAASDSSSLAASGSATPAASDNLPPAARGNSPRTIATRRPRVPQIPDFGAFAACARCTRRSAPRSRGGDCPGTSSSARAAYARSNSSPRRSS